MEQQNIKHNESLPVEFTFVNAGAGAGKTTNLVGHIIDIFVRYKKTFGRDPRIIGTTFTRKAANEIKERIASQYLKYNPKNSHLLTELDLNNPNKEFIEQNLEELLDFAYSESLNITTIHGICLQVIMKKAYLLGYSPNLSVVSESHLGFAKKRILYKYMNDSVYEPLYSYFSFSEIMGLMDQLNQKKDVIQKPASLEDLDQIYSDLLNEIRSKSDLILKCDVNALGNFAAQTEKVHQYISEIKKGLAQCFEDGDLRALHNALENCSVPSPRGKQYDPTHLDNLRKFKDVVAEIKDSFLNDGKYSKCFDKAQFPLVTEVTHLIFELYKKYYQELREYKRSESLVSMNDVEELALEILQKFPDECQDYIDMWDYWYIDEYQDTSPIQGQIFNILLKDKSYYKVGDPQQSIYLFRGAESSLFIKEWEQAQSSNVVIDKLLNTNYRSHPNLMAGMNEFFAHLEKMSSEFDESFNPMKSSKEIADEDGVRLSIHGFNENQKEMSFVVENIENLIAEGISPKDICVLARSKKILVEYESEFAARQIPSVAQFSGGLADRPEVMGLRCFLAVMANPDDDLNLITLLRTQNFKVDDNTLKEWTDAYKEQKDWSLWESLQQSVHPSIIQIKELYYFFKEKDYVQGLKKYFSQSTLMSSAYGQIDLARRKANLLKIYSYICQKSESSDFTLESILSQLDEKGIEEIQSEAVFSESQNGVRLFTIHGSKGLEFKYVFLVGSGKKGQLSDVEDVEVMNETGLFVIPVTNPEDRDRKSTVLRYFAHRQRTLAEKKEIRRVIYVAATRAKERLYITGVVNEVKDKENGGTKLSAQIHSLFNIIDINNFMNRNWKHMATFMDLAKADDDSKPQEFKHLEFDLEGHQLEQELIKNLYSSVMVTKDLRRESTVIPMSVSSVVEWFSETSLIDFKYEETERQKISKVNFNSFIDHDRKSSSPVMEQFLKPYIGDLFHKSVELFSKDIKGQDLKFYLKNFFSQGSDEVYNLIQEISEIKKPKMADILKTAKPEWGFNSLLNDRLLLSGQIDLWGMDLENTIHILDYKTGSLFHLKKAAFQLGLYKKVLAPLYPQHKIKTHVLYPTEGVFVTIETGEIDLRPLLNPEL